MTHPLEGIRERLKRADENIQDFNLEITQFLAPAPVVTWTVERNHLVYTDEGRKAFDELREFVASQVPLRFSVLAGEIIHHFRSVFDHLAWQLSSPDFQAKSPKQIEFPVFKEERLCGIAKKEMCAYCRKVEGIASPTALTRIDGLQPYRTPDPSRAALWRIHDMDIFDKHRELKLAVFTGQLHTFANVQAQGIAQQMPWEIRPRGPVIYTEPPKVDMGAKLIAQVAFGEISGREDKPIIATLKDFLSFTSDAIESFAPEFL
jgi:hypothetical protein